MGIKSNKVSPIGNSLYPSVETKVRSGGLKGCHQQHFLYISTILELMQVHFFPSAMTIFKINSIEEICLFLWPKVLLKQRNRVAKSTPMHQRQKLGPNGLPEDLWTNKPSSAFSESLKKQIAPMTTSNDCLALCFHLTIQDLHFYQKKKTRIFTLLQLIIALFEQYSEK